MKSTTNSWTNNRWIVQRIRFEVAAVAVVWVVVFEVFHWHPEPVWILVSMATPPVADAAISLLRRRARAKGASLVNPGSGAHSVESEN